MANNSDGNLIFLLGGTILGVITGLIFFAVKNDFVVSIFGLGKTSFMIGMVVCLLVFALLGGVVGWLFCFLRK